MVNKLLPLNIGYYTEYGTIGEVLKIGNEPRILRSSINLLQDMTP